jgi:tetratricopeptide (TPR) repeat protein
VGRERSPVTSVVLGLARAMAGDLDGANAALATVGGDPLSDWLRSQALAASGRVAEALAPLQGKDLYFYGLSNAVVLSYAGRRREAAAAIERAASHPDADANQMRIMGSFVLAAAGDPEGSRRAWPGRDMMPTLDMLSHFEAGDDERLAAIQGSFVPGGVGGQLAVALLAWRQGRRADALAALRALDRPAGWFVPYYRGLLAAEAGQHEEAVEALRRFERPMLFWGDGLLHPWLQARARLQLARSLDALGRRDEGRKYVELQLVRWKQADPELPLLVEARAVCRQLGCQLP